MEILVKPVKCIEYIEVGYNADCEFCIDCSGLGIWLLRLGGVYMELLVKPLDINAETVIDGCTVDCIGDCTFSF